MSPLYNGVFPPTHLSHLTFHCIKFLTETNILSPIQRKGKTPNPEGSHFVRSMSPPETPGRIEIVVYPDTEKT